jgi:hypothetical protein
MRDALKNAGYSSTRAEGVKAAQKSLGKNWRQRYFLDQLTNSHAYTTGLTNPKLGEKTSKLRQGLFPITHKVSDRFIRAMALNAAMRSAPEVRALMKGGNKFDDAVTKALEDPKTGMDLRDRVSGQLNDVMGDYHTLGATERKIRDLVPFWTWQRHILRYSKNSALHRPGRTALTVQTGFQGTQKTQDLLGQAPELSQGRPAPGPARHEGPRAYRGHPPDAGAQPLRFAPRCHRLGHERDAGYRHRQAWRAPRGRDPRVEPEPARAAGHRAHLGPPAPLRRSASGRAHLGLRWLPPAGRSREGPLGGTPVPKPNKATGKVTPFLLSKDAGQQARSLGGSRPGSSTSSARSISTTRNTTSKRVARRRSRPVSQTDVASRLYVLARKQGLSDEQAREFVSAGYRRVQP